MITRNILRKFTRADGIFLACLLATLGGILLYNANKQAEGFITVAHDNPERFVNGENVLIKRVHEEHWDIFYEFAKACPDSRKTEENYRVLREKLEEGIRAWLAPLREITDRPIVDKFVFHKSKITDLYRAENDAQVEYEITARFVCLTGGRSSASREVRSMFIMENSNGKNSPAFGNLPYSGVVLWHELGHVFDLADTYTGNRGFSPPSTGSTPDTIGSQPRSVMSTGGCWGAKKSGLCLDDERAIQWLYRYHWEGLDPTECPPEFVYEELTWGRKVGGCVYKHPLLIELRQRHLDNIEKLLAHDTNLKINAQDEHGYAALHYIAPLHLDFDNKSIRSILKKILDYPDIDANITDNYGNTPLHWAAWFGNFRMLADLLFIPGDYEIFENKAIQLNNQNKYGETALHYAAKFGREVCVRDILLRRTDINPNIKEHRAGNTPLHEAAKNGHTEIVTMLLAHQDINPNLRNDAGFTPLQLAMQGGAVAAADSDASFQAQHPELWVSLSEEHRQQLLESSRLSPAELQRARAEIAALLRAYPGIILPDASDVNGDGVVNILDLVKVSNAFGQRGRVPEDVNGDGIVNIQDLVWVSGAFGQE